MGSAVSGESLHIGMVNTSITYIQLFGIGFSLGLAGPCLFTCVPLVMSFIAGKRAPFFEGIRDIIIFLLGRFLAYLVLGYAAGISGRYLRVIASGVFEPFLRIIGGLVIISMGVYVGLGKNFLERKCPSLSKFTGAGGLFILGVFIGLSPCPPLAALLIELAMVSNSGLDALSYTFFFGLGTLVSGLLTLGLLGGFFSWFPQKIFNSDKSKLVFRMACSLLLIFLGLNLILIFFKTNF